MIIATLITISAIFIFLILLLFLWPLSYRGSFVYERTFSYEIELKTILLGFFYRKDEDGAERWLKIVGLTLFCSREERGREAEKEVSGKKTEDEITDRIKSLPREINREFISRANLSHLKKYLIRLVNNLKPRSYSLELKVGGLEPHHNGFILSFYYAFIYPWAGDEINCYINWEEEVFASRGEVKGRFRPAEIIFTLLSFLFSRRTMKIIYHKIKRRRFS